MNRWCGSNARYESSGSQIDAGAAIGPHLRHVRYGVRARVIESIPRVDSFGLLRERLQEGVDRGTGDGA
jgi:hypothetical protein